MPNRSQRLCNGRGLGPGLEAGRAPGLKSVALHVVWFSWSLLVVCGWSQNGAVLFQFSLLLLSWVEQVVPAQLLCCSSGLSCLISNASLASQVQRLFLHVLVFKLKLWLSESFEERKSCVVFETEVGVPSHYSCWMFLRKNLPRWSHMSKIAAARMAKNISVVGRWQSRRRTKVCYKRHTQFGYNQGRLGDKTLLEKCLLCVSGNDNELERHAVVHLPQNKVFWDVCGQ